MDIYIIVFILGVACCCYVAGYATADSRERKALKAVYKQRDEVNHRYLVLRNWVQVNWPTEWAAYKRGKIEGYKQGLYDAPELIAESELTYE